MSNTLPVSQDVQPSTITPEGAMVANTYLENKCDLVKTAEYLDMEKHEIDAILSSTHVKSYVHGMLVEAGLRNFDKISTAMQDLIDDKLEEMKDLEMTSTKDIADLLNMLHKMEVDKQNIIAKRQPKETTVNTGNTSNTQVNIFDANDNSQYGRLMRAIADGK